MKITAVFRITNLILAGFFVGYAFGEKSLWIGVVISIAWVIFWGVSQLLDNQLTPDIFFLGYAILCLVGTFMGLHLVLLFLGITAALNVWDTDRFYRRWQDTLKETRFTVPERRRLLRLLLVDGLAFILAVIGLTIEIQLNFGLMLLVVVIALLSLTQLIRLLRNQGAKT
jgi:hypothetical protein